MNAVTSKHMLNNTSILHKSINKQIMIWQRIISKNLTDRGLVIVEVGHNQLGMSTNI